MRNLSLGICLCLLSASAFAARPARSAIFYIGDGMGIAQVTAARVYQGNARDGKLALDTFPNVALVRTYSTSSTVTDSAAAATALAGGIKTKNAMIGMDPDGKPAPSLLKAAKAAGKSVGLITTTTITHATPACFYASIPERASEAEIADQLIAYGEVDLIMGGGRQFFNPKSAKDEESGGASKRSDERNLIEEAKAKGYRFVANKTEFDAYAAEAAKTGKPGKLLALFNDGMMCYEAERAADPWGEPSIAEMTGLAISILSKNPKGYFLMVEGGRIDHACHANQAQLAVTDLLAFDSAIQLGLDQIKKDARTLVVVTADHETGGLAINGYPPLETTKGTGLFAGPSVPGNPNIVTFASGPGHDRGAMDGIAQASPQYRQPSLIPGRSALHTGVDVGCWAAGRGSEAYEGVLENTEIPVIMAKVMGLKLVR